MTLRGFLVVALALGLVGCDRVKNARERSRDQNALAALVVDYAGFQEAHSGRPPASAEELTAFTTKAGKSELKPGELEKLTVQWGAKFGSGPDAGGRVLASSPAVGGTVSLLMQDGSIRAVPEAEAAKMPKAEKAKLDKTEPEKTEPGKKEPGK